MIFGTFLIIFFVHYPAIGIGQRTSTSSTARISSTTSTSTTTIPRWTDPTIGGRYGNPGAQIHLTNKSITAVTTNALDSISKAINNITIPDISFPVFLDTLTIKTLRVTEVKFGNIDNQYFQPNRIQTRFYGGRIVATGGWNYKPYGNKPETKGLFRATIGDGEIKLVNQMARTVEARPVVQTMECRVSYKNMKAEIDGAPPGQNVIESCTNPVCNLIRAHFETIICTIVRTFIAESINRPLSTMPTRIQLNCSNQFFADYGLLISDPKVTNAQMIRAGMEGRILWRNQSSGNPFSPHDFQIPSNKSMITFDLSDFAFNSLFHQAHSQSYRLSAFDLIPASNPLQDHLKFKCTSRPCLGAIFKDSSINRFPANASGDFVYKSKVRAIRAFVNGGRVGNLDGSSGVLEIYGPSIAATGQSAKRQLMAQVDLSLLRGDLVPSLKGNKIVATSKLNQLQFTAITRSAFVPDWQSKLAPIALPLLNEMFNNFISQIAQFPIPMPNGYECTAPQFSILARSMRVECDVRYAGGQTLGDC